MNKRKIMLTVGFLAITSLVLTSAMLVRQNNVSGFLETATSYEENHTDIELDFFLNVSGSISPFATQEVKPYQMLHARYSFSSRESLETIYGYDIFNLEFMIENQLTLLGSSDCLAKIVIADCSGVAIESMPGFEFVLYDNADDQVDNYWAVGGATTSAIAYPVTEESFVDEGATTTFLMNWTKAIDDTTAPTLTLDSQNLLVKDDDTQYLGTKYLAGDAMTLSEYATAIAAQAGVTLYDIANTSVIGWLMEDDEINTINVEFEEPTAVSSSPGAMSIRAGILRRFSFSLLRRNRENLYSTSSSLRRNFFSRIPTSRVISGIRSVPSNAKSYLSTAIGSNWQGKQIGIRSIAGGIKQSIGKLFGTIFSGTGLTVMALGYFGIGAIKAVRGGKLIWKPWKRSEWKLR